MTKHVLDNPVWNALISGNSHLSHGNDEVKYFDKEISPFVAFNENTTEHFRLLYEVLPDDRPAIFVTPEEIEIPGQWKALNFVRGLQMVCDSPAAIGESQLKLMPLTTDHVPQMVALARLTNPGPFESRTIEFGHYFGVFEGDQLVAMAGQRMHAIDYVEVSAVCTHPDHTGRGYARQLLLHQLHRLKEMVATPFLHVRVENKRAIDVYQHLGFSVRKEVYFYFMRGQNNRL